jgi:hypothetical protein
MARAHDASEAEVRCPKGTGISMEGFLVALITIYKNYQALNDLLCWESSV